MTEEPLNEQPQNEQAQPPARKELSPLVKLAIDLGPLIIFFLTYSRLGMITATGIFMAATAVAIAISWAMTRHVPAMTWFSAILVGVFGGLTIWLKDETFIKMKPTIVNTLFGAILLGGLLFGKSLLGYVFHAAFKLTDEGWRKLTLRWGLFFFVLAVLNEVVWRTQTQDFWVAFKVWGVMPLTMAFALAQTPLILKHEIKAAKIEE